MRHDWRRALLPGLGLALIVSAACSPPSILTLEPSSGPARGLVRIVGADYKAAALTWDGTPLPANEAGQLFSVPPDAVVGQTYTVTVADGFSVRTLTFTVSGPALDLGIPRIDDVMPLYATFAGSMMTASLYVQGANIDVGAEVLVDGTPVATVAHKALVKPMFGVEPFLGRPIYHYVALGAAIAPMPVGQTVTVTVRNLDSKVSDAYSFEVPESAELLDSDGDSLTDTWELTAEGIQVNGDPYRKNILVELDTMDDVTFDPPPEVIDAVRTMFRAAPLMNPYGEDGIALHVDDSGSDSVPFATTLYFDRSDATPPLSVPGETPPAVFSTLKAAHFDHSDLGDKYHYVIWAQRLTTDYAGMSDIPLDGGGGDDVAIAVASQTTAHFTTRTAAEVLAHELGHNLGQRHGGKTDQDRNPSYLSVMSGSWSMRTSRDANVRSLWPTCFPFYYAMAGADEGINSKLPPNLTLAIDYSAGMGADIVEGPLDELKGMCGHPIDWGHSGTFDPPPTNGSPPPSINVNKNSVDNETLSDFANWPNLIFNGPATNGTIP